MYSLSRRGLSRLAACQRTAGNWNPGVRLWQILIPGKKFVAVTLMTSFDHTYRLPPSGVCDFAHIGPERFESGAGAAH